MIKIMKKKKKVLRYKCWKCDVAFISYRARYKHFSEDHKPPKKTEKKFIREGDPHNLINGINLKLGDKVVFTKRGVITNITLTEGNNLANVKVSVIEDIWEKEMENN